MLFCARIHNEATNWLSKDYTQRNERDFTSSSIRSSSATMNSIKHVNFANDIHRFVLKTIYNTTQNARKYNNSLARNRINYISSNRENTQKCSQTIQIFRARRIILKYSKSRKSYYCGIICYQNITAKLRR